jgi:hypothetical protein
MLKVSLQPLLSRYSYGHALQSLLTGRKPVKLPVKPISHLRLKPLFWEQKPPELGQYIFDLPFAVCAHALDGLSRLLSHPYRSGENSGPGNGLKLATESCCTSGLRPSDEVRHTSFTQRYDPTWIGLPAFAGIGQQAEPHGIALPAESQEWVDKAKPSIRFGMNLAGEPILGTASFKPSTTTGLLDPRISISPTSSITSLVDGILGLGGEGKEKPRT